MLWSQVARSLAGDTSSTWATTRARIKNWLDFLLPALN